MGTKERVEILNNKDTAINELLKRISELEFEVEENNKEIDRLTEDSIVLATSLNRWIYIVERLEKWLDEEYQYADKHIFPGSMAGVAMGQINRTKNKLQELKGSDKE